MLSGFPMSAVPMSAMASDTVSEQLFPASTVSNSGWTAVGAATIWEALATGDSEYATTSTATAVTEVGMALPAVNFASLDLAAFVVRVRTG